MPIVFSFLVYFIYFLTSIYMEMIEKDYQVAVMRVKFYFY